MTFSSIATKVRSKIHLEKVNCFYLKHKRGLARLARMNSHKAIQEDLKGQTFNQREEY